MTAAFNDWLKEARERGFSGSIVEAQTRWELGQSADSFCKPAETELERATLLELLKSVSCLAAEIVRLEEHMKCHRREKGAYGRILQVAHDLHSAEYGIEQLFANSQDIFKNRP